MGYLDDFNHNLIMDSYMLSADWDGVYKFIKIFKNTFRIRTYLQISKKINSSKTNVRNQKQSFSNDFTFSAVQKTRVNVVNG